jgi:hypothetical protein
VTSDGAAGVVLSGAAVCCGAAVSVVGAVAAVAAGAAGVAGC